MDGYPKIASCACGALTVSTTAPPKFVHGCTCRDCQCRSGSAFSYSAFFRREAVTASGERRIWERRSDSGHMVETHFCPTCGCHVLLQAHSMPDLVGVPVGAFADPDFTAPRRLYWRTRRHGWLDRFAAIETRDTQ